MGKSVWYERILELASIDIARNGVTQQELIIRLGNMSAFTMQYYELDNEGNYARKSKAFSSKYLKANIKLGLVLKVFQYRNNNIFIGSNASKILDINERNTTLKVACEEALKQYGTIEKIIETIRKLKVPATIKNISKSLRVILYYSDSIVFQALLQIYGNINDILLWTGQVTFGINEDVPDPIKLPEKDLKIIDEVVIKSEKYKERNSIFKQFRDDDKIPVNVETYPLIVDEYNAKKKALRVIKKIISDEKNSDDDCEKEFKDYLEQEAFSADLGKHLEINYKEQLRQRQEYRKSFT